MKKLIMLLPIILLLYSFPVSAQKTTLYYVGTSSSEIEKFSNQGYYDTAAVESKEQQPPKETSAELADLEEKRTGLLIGGVVLFLVAMFVVRRKIKKSINEKLN